MGTREHVAARRRHHGARSPGAGRDDEPLLVHLQHVAGNRAVAGMLRPPAVQRSCCAGCASGGSCDKESDDEPRRAKVPVQRYYIEDCDNYPASQRRAGVQIATAEAGRALSALQRYVNAKGPARDATTARLLRENFTSDSSSTAFKALVRFAKIKRYLDNDDFTIECETSCDDAKAYVYGVWTDIHMCMNFMKNESDLRFGEILLHEVSHDAAGTDDEEYYYPSRTTTTLSRGDALDNADSYESFAAQIP